MKIIKIKIQYVKYNPYYLKYIPEQLLVGVYLSYFINKNRESIMRVILPNAIALDTPKRAPFLGGHV